MAQLMPSLRQKFYDDNGLPLDSGKIYTYVAGDVTPLATYVDKAGVSTNTNPIILDANGEANIWLGSSAYKFVIKTSADVVVRTVDNISYINAGSITGAMFADNSITTAKIQDDAVTEDKIADASVSEDKLGASAVSLGKVKDKVKMAFVSSGELLPRYSWSTPAKITTQTFSSDGVIDVAFSPNGKLLAIAAIEEVVIGGDALHFYSRSNNSFVFETVNALAFSATAAYSVAFSPNGIFLAVAFIVSPYVMIFKIDGLTLTALSNPGSLPTGAGIGVAWSSEGKYLAVAHTTTPFVTVYARTSNAVFSKLTNPASLPAGNATGVAWNNDTSLLAVSHATTPFVSIYQTSLNVSNPVLTTLTKISNPGTLPAGNATGVAWSPDGTLLVVTHATSPYITIYEVSGTTFTKITNPGTLPTGQANGASFNGDGTFLAIAHTTTPYVTIYACTGSAGARTFTKQTNPVSLPAGDATGVSFTEDNQFLAVAHSTTPFATIYKTASTLTDDALLYIPEVTNV